MIPWFSKLKWQSFNQFTQNNRPFSELKEFADYTFDNGVEIRISTGKMALTNREYPYEMYVLYPHGAKKNIPYLNKTTLIAKMNEINRL